MLFPLGVMRSICRTLHGAGWLGVTWSLAVEEQFYLILPLLIHLIAPQRMLAVSLLLALTAPLLRTWLFYSHSHGALAGYVLLPCRWDALLIGLAGAVLVRRRPLAAWLASGHASRTLACLFAVLLLGAFMLTLQVPAIGSLAMASIGHTWLALLALLTILVAQFGPWAGFHKMFRARWLAWLGGISYGLYLFHQIILGLCHLWLRGDAPTINSWADAGTTLLSLALSLLVASLSWRYFERPLVGLGHGVKY